MAIFSDRDRERNPILRAEDHNPWFMMNMSARYRTRKKAAKKGTSEPEIWWPTDEEILRGHYKKGKVPPITATDLNQCGVTGYDLALGVYLLNQMNRKMTGTAARFIGGLIKAFALIMLILVLLLLGVIASNFSFINFFCYSVGLAGILIQLWRSDFSGMTAHATHQILNFHFHVEGAGKKVEDLGLLKVLINAIVSILIFLFVGVLIIFFTGFFLKGTLSFIGSTLQTMPFAIPSWIIAWVIGAILLTFELFRAVRFKPLHESIISGLLESFYHSRNCVEDFAFVKEIKDQPDYDNWWWEQNEVFACNFYEKHKDDAPPGFDHQSHLKGLGYDLEERYRELYRDR